MTTVNPAGAAERLLGLKTVTPAECLVAVRRALLQDVPATRHAGSALIEWDNTPGRHRDTVGPADTPVYFAGPRGFGDVTLSLGDGLRVVAIDTADGKYKRGIVGIQTIAQREKQVGGKLLGWSSEFLGHPLEWPVVAPPKPPTNMPSAVLVDAQKVARLAGYLNRRFGPRYHTNAASNGARGTIYWRLVQMAGKADGLYGAGYIINGLPGSKTRQVEAIYFARGLG